MSPDFEATKKIIEAQPLLLNCTNQSKKGDIETALGGASHMGRKDKADPHRPAARRIIPLNNRYPQGQPRQLKIGISRMPP